MGPSIPRYWQRVRDYLQRVPTSKRACARERSGRRPLVERLEDRIVPAFDLTLSLNPTVGVTATVVPGTTTFTATASGANLSWADIANTLAVTGDNVIVNSGGGGTEAGNITDQLLGGIAVNNLSKNLSFQSGSGAGLVGDITIGSVRFVNGNGSIDVAANRNVSVGSLDFQAGQLTSSSLSAATGSGSCGIDQAVHLDVSARAVISMSSAATNLVAQTSTGGIVINNTGDLTVGFAGEPFAGVRDTGAGDIQLTNAGSVTITTNGDIVKGPGNITITANGAAADVQTGGDNDGTTGNGAIQAGGMATVTAGP